MNNYFLTKVRDYSGVEQVSLAQVDAILGAFFRAVREEVGAGNKVQIARLGTFRRRLLKPRIVVNRLQGPETVHHVPERWRVHFKPSRLFLEAINGGKGGK